MKTTPNFGFPYPEPADNTETWEYWQQLATALDTMLAKGSAGPRVIVSGSASAALIAGAKMLDFPTTEQNVGFTVGSETASGQTYTILTPPVDGWYDAYAFAYIPQAGTTAPKGSRVVEMKYWDGTAYASQGAIMGAAPGTSPNTGMAYLNMSAPMLLKAGQKCFVQVYSPETGWNITTRRAALALRAPLTS